MCNYSSMEGVLYCKPHFEQLFKETGTFTKKFPTGDFPLFFSDPKSIYCWLLLLPEAWFLVCDPSGIKAGERNELVSRSDDLGIRCLLPFVFLMFKPWCMYVWHGLPSLKRQASSPPCSVELRTNVQAARKQRTPWRRSDLSAHL